MSNPIQNLSYDREPTAPGCASRTPLPPPPLQWLAWPAHADPPLVSTCMTMLMLSMWPVVKPCNQV
eukprot:CAMPEP_0202857612 /NCGR_PEP_ID=MMETSP1391-20130828/487_1 /ASSEMBLY_ACC=CAM_ASM_000867 /TAXON_ID=1034604 /ORGANISM="Chlamydomonas leiostraca, Strain SAG 11-49" /LENGTH=65 /DNA_ID=CAMNT_0049536431 /DNA_START=101 /DNA_END=298 /DNA_ORIENTATION=+